VTARRFGDTGLVVDVATLADAHRLGAELTRRAATGSGPWVGVEDVVAGIDTVTVIADPVRADLDALAAAVEAAAMEAAAEGAGAGPDSDRSAPVEIPVVFDGPDLQAVAGAAGVGTDAVVGMLLDARLTVAMIGFAPGFAYLAGLPASLAAVPRRNTARTSVPAGSVAIAGGFAAVYPASSPGGWQLVGRTGATLFQTEREPYGLLKAGDRVRFTPSPDGLVERAGGDGSPRVALRAGDGRRAVRVEDPGALSTVQDLGRVGVAALGVPRAGAADPVGLRVANRLVGNIEGAAAIEATVRGPVLAFGDDAHVALVGHAPLLLDGLPVPNDGVVPIRRGQRLTVGMVRRGARVVVAVSGGIDIDPVLGSRSSDLLCGLGPGPLRAGDALPLGAPGRPRGDRAPVLPATDDVIAPDAVVLRVVAGPDRPDLLDHLAQRSWRVGADSNRIGIRLEGEEGGNAPGPDTSLTSRAMVTGAVQVPPDGRPIVLGCDHATTGGFPVVATVVSADHGRLGQCRPGDLVRLVAVTIDEARRQRAGLERFIASVGQAWYPTTGA